MRSATLSYNFTKAFRKFAQRSKILLRLTNLIYSFRVELTRDLGIYISCPNSGITIAASAHNHYFGLVHPQGKFYQRNGDLQIQILNSNDFER